MLLTRMRPSWFLAGIMVLWGCVTLVSPFPGQITAQDLKQRAFSVTGFHRSPELRVDCRIARARRRYRSWILSRRELREHAARVEPPAQHASPL